VLGFTPTLLNLHPSIVRDSLLFNIMLKLNESRHPASPGAATLLARHSCQSHAACLFAICLEHATLLKLQPHMSSVVHSLPLVREPIWHPCPAFLQWSLRCTSKHHKQLCMMFLRQALPCHIWTSARDCSPLLPMLFYNLTSQLDWPAGSVAFSLLTHFFAILLSFCSPAQPHLYLLLCTLLLLPP